jgi:hypothetical protein
MELSKSRLIENLEKTQKYLAQKVAIQPSYACLIQTLDSTIETLKESIKPVVKFVSPSVRLASKLKEQSEENKILRSLYNFQAVSPIKQLYEIVKNCDVICLVYNSRHNIQKHHQKLIELAQQNNISLILLVIQTKIDYPYTHLSNWLTAQNYSQVNQLLLGWDNFGNLEDLHYQDSYQQLLIQLHTTVTVQSQERIIKEIIPQIKHFFYIEITNTQQNKNNLSQIVNTVEYQQVIKKNKQEIKQYIQNTKQTIQQSKSDYLNPFRSDTWMYQIQEIIQSSQVQITTENGKPYVELIVKNNKNTEYLHSYILSLYQQKIIDTLVFQWSNINYVYEEGGLQVLINKINAELETVISPDLSQIEIPKFTLITELKPNLDLTTIIDNHCLRGHTRIPFDYNFTQSSWFRFLISCLIGLGIYLVTKLYFGTGKYIGFFILIFQIINLLTGQSIKKTKIKQHQKELKRLVDNKYQNLIRIIVDKLTQTLINYLESVSQLYQQQIEKIITNELQPKPETTQTTNNLQQDKEKILDLLHKYNSNQF